MVTPPPDAFAIRFPVVPGDIDALGHVNNVVYVRWVQEAAVAHWRAAALPADQVALRWVVVRHEIDYKRAAQLGDEIVARTWVGTASRYAFERHTELSRARTLWCPVDAATGKRTDVSAAVRDRFSVG